MRTATDADYQALLALMTPGWEKQPLAQFNAQLLDWANAHADVRRRLDADLAYDVQPAGLADTEAFFLQHTVFLSSMEIDRHVDSVYSETTEHPPAADVRLPEKRLPRSAGPDVWADLRLSFSYCVDDPLCTTVAERDQAVAAVAEAVRRFWAEHTLDEVLQLGEAEMRRQLETLVRNSSPDGIRFTLAPDDFSLETTTG